MVSRRDGIKDTGKSSEYAQMLRTSSRSTMDGRRNVHGFMISVKVMRLHSSCTSGIVNRTKTLSLGSLSNKDVMGESDNKGKGLVRYTSSDFL